MPFGVMTWMWFTPVECAGDLTVRVVSDTTVKLVPGVFPNNTDVAPVNPVPVTVTTVPPACGPDAGLTPVTAGAAAYVNRSPETVLLLPFGVKTCTLIEPAASAGEVTVKDVSDATFNPVPATLPNSTDVAPVKPVPVTVTTVPPLEGPPTGLTEVTPGSDGYVNKSVLTVGLLPFGVTTCTLIDPAASAGDATVNDVSETTVNEVPATFPNNTDVAPVKPVPVTVTTVPPADGPEAGETPVTAGSDE